MNSKLKCQMKTEDLGVRDRERCMECKRKGRSMERETKKRRGIREKQKKINKKGMRGYKKDNKAN